MTAVRFLTLPVSAALLVTMFAAGPNTALAQNAIGGTVVVQNDVSSQKSGKRQFLRLRKGAHVFQDDLVRTSKNSLTKIVFLDKTNMSVGPESEAKLDKFVYSGDGTAKDVIVEATKGTFRFFSGDSASKAYRVVTPQAVIGVRGTTYDVRIEGGQTLVVLQDGEVNVCVRNSANCRVMNQPGQSVNVDDNGNITDPAPAANKPWDFASLCTGSASVLCAKTSQFALAPQPKPKAIAPKVTPKKVKPRPRQRTRPQRRVRPRQRARPRQRIRPRRTVRRPRGEWVREPIYEPPPRRPIIEGPIYVPRPRCYPGSRHPRCRTVRPRPRPCYGVWRRGRCITRPIVRPRPCSGVWRHGRCVTRPIVRPRPKPCRYSRHGCGRRPIVRPRPPSHGRPIYRPRPRPSYGTRPHSRPSYRRPSRTERRTYRPRNRGGNRYRGSNSRRGSRGTF